jgi:hypothetical protein
MVVSWEVKSSWFGVDTTTPGRVLFFIYLQMILQQVG